MREKLKAAVLHVVCVIALMWTGLVNGQPFFFPDSTNYIRIADSAAFIASKHRISTVWTDRYRDAVEAPGPAAGAPAAPPRANDLGSGTIMAGRSPYLGAWLWLSYVVGDFWPFVLVNAGVAYLLIRLSLHRFGLLRDRNVLIAVAVLAGMTSLPTFDAMLLADPFAPFGVLALILLATPGRLNRVETAFLVALTLVSASFHLTHITMFAAMTVAILMLRWRLPKLAVPPRAWIAGVAAVAIGLLSVQATALAARAAFGRAPQLLPLLTARFYLDGPGKRFVESGCEGERFAICHVPIVMPPGNGAWLFSPEPGTGAYLLAAPAERQRMGNEDIAFALAVLRYDPAGEIRMMAFNTLRQLAWIDYDGLNTGCPRSEPDCWAALPPPVRATLEASPSGRNAWPVAAMNALLYLAVLGSAAIVAIGLPRLARRDPAAARALTLWLLLGATAFLTNAFFGGAVADPQYRYTGRMVWLLVLPGVIVALRLRSRDVPAD